MKKKLLLLLLLPTFAFSQWTQIGKDIDGEYGDESGSSVSLSADGSIIAIGSKHGSGGGGTAGGIKGDVRVYRNQSGKWIQIGQDIHGEADLDFSGHSVSLNADGSIVAISAVNNDGNGRESGHVRVYQNQSEIWTQIGQDIDGEGIDDHFGQSISLNAEGNIVAIAASGIANGAGIYEHRGHVGVYRIQSGMWTQMGQDINGDGVNSYFGWSVSLSANGYEIAIGGIGPGQPERVFQHQSGTWMQIGQDIFGEESFDYAGNSVSLSADGSRVAIGSNANDSNGDYSGQVRIYENQDGTWVQMGQEINGEHLYDNSGYAVSLAADGNIVAIGAIQNSGNGSSSGHVRVYQYQSGTWIQSGQDIDGEASKDESGRALSLNASGSVLAVGAPYNDGNGSSSGHVRVYKNENLNLSQNTIAKDIVMYPNPSRETTQIHMAKIYNELTLEIVDVLGKSIDLFKFSNTDHITLDTSNYKKGIYVVQLLSQEHKASIKLIVN